MVAAAVVVAAAARPAGPAAGAARHPGPGRRPGASFAPQPAPCPCAHPILHLGRPAVARLVASPAPAPAVARERTSSAGQPPERAPGGGAHRDGSSALSLANIRDTLIKLEDTIIFSLIERSQFKSNATAYESGGIPVPGFCTGGRRYSLLEWLLFETEQTHGKIRRYTSPDELPFFPEDVPPLVLPPMDFPKVLAPFSFEINYNQQIMKLYLEDVIPAITEEGDDQNYGSACLVDVTLLQALSKRIHYGKFVAEAKFLAQTEEYTKLIKAKDADGIMDLLTDIQQEGRVLDRVKLKAATFGQDMSANTDHPVHKVDPDTVAQFYRDWMMPLTKDVEVDYLMRRLEWARR